MLASSSGNLGMTDMILVAGADVNTADKVNIIIFERFWTIVRRCLALNKKAFFTHTSMTRIHNAVSLRNI